MVDVMDLLKRARRLLDGNYSPRKVLLVAMLVLVFLLYTGPYLLRLLFSSASPSLLTESASHSVASRVNHFKAALAAMDAHLLHTHPPAAVNTVLQQQQQQADGQSSPLPPQEFIPYAGNGFIGVWVRELAPGDSSLLQHQQQQGSGAGAPPAAAAGAVGRDCSQLYIRHGRSLSLAVPYEALLNVHVDGGSVHEAVVTHYTTATVHRIQAWELPSIATNHRTADSDVNGEIMGGAAAPPLPVEVVDEGVEGSVEVTHRVFAHRTIPELLLQDVVVINPNPVSVFVRVGRVGHRHWSHVATDTFTVEGSSPGSQQHQYTVVTGTVAAPAQLTHRHKQGSSKVIVVAVATLHLPSILKVAGRMSTTLHVLTAVNYSAPVPQHLLQQHTLAAKQAVIQTIRSAVSGSMASLSASHVEAWAWLWRSGVHLATSRAEAAINGDLINATLYNVLSQVRAPLQEVTTSPASWQQLVAQLSPAASEGCYQGHHTLQAEKLWSHLSTVEDVNRVVAAWLITLEKQGCHGLLKAGADGALQAMLLSLGGLCFRNQHLEFNTQARDLHRDLTFRRLRYGVGVYLNLSVEVQDHDYKPVLWLNMEQQQQQHVPAPPPPPGGAAAAGGGNHIGAALGGGGGGGDSMLLSETSNELAADVKAAVADPASSSAGRMFINANYVRMNGGDQTDEARNNRDNNKSASGGGGGGGGGQQSFYACDGGCLDPPVELGFQPQQFPVKLTEPVTAVLYITSDRQHMEELKHSIHVREVAIAPGHHQSVIALHRHGHKWGSLPPLFWLSIAALIVTFHLFLFKLVVNEYCSGDARVRYRKLSDF